MDPKGFNLNVGVKLKIKKRIDQNVFVAMQGFCVSDWFPLYKWLF